MNIMQLFSRLISILKKESVSNIRSLKELKRTARTLSSYEMAMLRHTGDRLSLLKAGAERNINSECFLLHARNVGDFLNFSKKKDDDDVGARDYLPTWKPGSLCKFYLSKRRQLNKAAFHVTYSRIKFEEEHTKLSIDDCHRIYIELKTAWSAFLNALPADRRAWFGCRDEHR